MTGIKTTIVVISVNLTKEEINTNVSAVVGADISNNNEYEIFVVSDNSVLQQLRNENREFILIVDLSDKKSASDYAFTNLVKEYSADELCRLMFNSLCHNFLISILANQITSVDNEEHDEIVEDSKEECILVNEKVTHSRDSDIVSIIEEMRSAMDAGFDKLKRTLTEP